jgi:hypothetical protein
MYAEATNRSASIKKTLEYADAGLVKMDLAKSLAPAPSSPPSPNAIA